MSSIDILWGLEKVPVLYLLASKRRIAGNGYPKARGVKAI
jgi:hypothetical protein